MSTLVSTVARSPDADSRSSFGIGVSHFFSQRQPHGKSLVITECITIASLADQSKARRQFADVLGRVAYGREEIVIERAGRPMAVLVNLEEYRRLKALEANQREAELAARFALIRQAGDRNALGDDEAFAVGLALTEEVRHPDAEG